jgi:hypothetical protein
MKLKFGMIALVGCTAVFLGSQAALADVSQGYRAAEGKLILAELSPAKRAEVEGRLAQGGQTVNEILQTILLNSIKLKYPANRIVALDFGRGIAVVELPSNVTRTISFDTQTLAIKD